MHIGGEAEGLASGRGNIKGYLFIIDLVVKQINDWNLFVM